jgi:stalled ribosome rescue protein Dom34
MPPHFHTVVCIDHAEALVFAFAQNGVTESRIRPKERNGNIHHKAGSSGSGHAHDSKAYLTAVTDALQPSHEILIVGHGTAKEELASFIHDHVPALAPRIMGVETVDQPTKGKREGDAVQCLAG